MKEKSFRDYLNSQESVVADLVNNLIKRGDVDLIRNIAAYLRQYIDEIVPGDTFYEYLLETLHQADS